MIMAGGGGGGGRKKKVRMREKGGGWFEASMRNYRMACRETEVFFKV